MIGIVMSQSASKFLALTVLHYSAENLMSLKPQRRESGRKTRLFDKKHINLSISSDTNTGNIIKSLARLTLVNEVACLQRNRNLALSGKFLNISSNVGLPEPSEVYNKAGAAGSPEIHQLRSLSASSSNDLTERAKKSRSISN